jgi:hypothetical protein
MKGEDREGNILGKRESTIMMAMSVLSPIQENLTQNCGC